VSRKFEDIEEHLVKDEFREVLRLLEAIEAQPDLTDEERLQSQLKRLYIYSQTGMELDTRLQFANELLEKCRALGEPLYFIDALCIKSNILVLGDQFQESDELDLEAERLVDSLLKESDMSSTKMDKPALFFRKARILNKKGFRLVEVGNLTKGIKYLEHSLKLYEEIHHHEIYLPLGNLGVAYQQKGELDTALGYFEEALRVSQELGNKNFSATILMVIGHIYRAKGDMKKALELSERAQLLADEAKGPSITVVLIYSGDFYWQLGDLDRAAKLIKHGLKLELANPTYPRFLITFATYLLAMVAIDQRDWDQANKCLERLQAISDENPSHLYNSQRYRVAKAIFLKTSPRLRNRIQAEELLQEVINEEGTSQLITIDAMLHLCALRLFELRISGNPDVLKEIQELLVRLRGIAQSSGSFWVLAETHVLQARLALVELDFKEARNHLTQAQIVAEEQQMSRLATEIAQEYDVLMERLERWEEFVAQKSSMQDRSDILQLEALVSRMIYVRHTDLEAPVIRAHVIVPESFAVNEEIRLAIDLINIGRKPGLALRIHKLLPKRFTLLEIQPEYTVEGDSLILGGKLLGPMQAISLNLRVRIEGNDSIELNPQVVYANLQGDFEISHSKTLRMTPLLTFESDKAQMMFEHLVDAFRTDNMNKGLKAEESGWRTRTQVLKSEPQLNKRDLYGSRGQFGRLLKELHDHGMVEVRSEAGKRSRGGQRLKIRVAYDREAVKQYVSKK
jgi:tetratricopeptide (TPR) repeat protein